MYGFCGENTEYMGFMVTLMCVFCGEDTECVVFMVTLINICVLWWRYRMYGFYGDFN
jgi:hypothetical protein